MAPIRRNIAASSRSLSAGRASLCRSGFATSECYHPHMSGPSAAVAAPRVPAPVIRGVGLVVSLAYAAAIGWVYLHQPQTMAEVRGGLASSVGVYRPDPIAFADGLRLLPSGSIRGGSPRVRSRGSAHRNPTTQFYVAYSFYRQGWGRVYADSALYARGLEAVDRAALASPTGHVVVDDPELQMHSSEELKAELQRGMTHELSDLNPMNVLRTRK